MRTISYLLLGEGDFTYSLDLCRYIASRSRQKAHGDYDHEAVLHSITCTGVDTSEELRGKYKDADFVLRNIRSCANFDENTDNDGSSCSKFGLATTILHGVNAVQAEPAAINGGSTQKQQLQQTQQQHLQHFDRVMFHHPHLGREDAQLHSRFLHHFFHAAVNRWLKPGSGTSDTFRNNIAKINDIGEDKSQRYESETQGGLLYITLVNGQCSRWKCIEAAKNHGLILIRRTPFCPPPAVANQTTYYQLRRHQSGKSFAKRRRMQQDDGDESHQSNEVYEDQNDSETLVFGRASDYMHIISSGNNIKQSCKVGLLPWEKDASRSTTSMRPRGNQYPCQYCVKSFLEERSLKNHMLNVHPNCKEVASLAAKKILKKKSKVPANENGEGEVVDSNMNSAPQQSNVNLSTKCSTNKTPLTCSICEVQKQNDPKTNGTPRTFPHVQALRDHQRAKHFGSHTDIKPDWCNTGKNYEKTASNDLVAVEQIISGACSVCGIKYSSEADRAKHELEFVPLPSTQTRQTHSEGSLHDTTVSYKCKYCSKSFRGIRAQQQHENFCMSRDVLMVK